MPLRSTPPSKKKPKKHVQNDPTWHSSSSSLGGATSPRALLSLMGAASSPSKRGVTVLSARSPMRIASTVQGPHHLWPHDVDLSSPLRGAGTTSVRKRTPNHTRLKRKRLIKREDEKGLDTISIFLPEDKATRFEETLPTRVPDSLQGITLNPIHAHLPNWVPITLKKLTKIDKIKSKRTSPRLTDQNTIMGMPASKAAECAGFPIGQDHTWHWCHLYAHSLVGDDGQIVSNLVLGTKEANAEMTLVELVIRKILQAHKKNGLDTLYLKVIPEFVPSFEKIRLAKSLTYTIQDKPGMTFTKKVTFSFNMLSRNKTSVSEIPIIEKLLISLFEGKTKLDTNKENADTLNIETAKQHAKRQETLRLLTSATEEDDDEQDESFETRYLSKSTPPASFSSTYLPRFQLEQSKSAVSEGGAAPTTPIDPLSASKSVTPPVKKY